MLVRVLQRNRTIRRDVDIDIGFQGGASDKESACNAETQVQSLGQEDPLEKGTATHFSILT